MKFIVFSPVNSLKNETDVVNYFFEKGLEIFHLRKPNYSEKFVRNYLDRIDTRFINRIVLHQFHFLNKEYSIRGIHYKSSEKVNGNDKICLSKSFHSLDEVNMEANKLNYCTISPIFDSISKIGYKAMKIPNLREKLKALNSMFSNLELIGLGGITEKNCTQILEMGFNGVGVLGHIWKPMILNQNIDDTIVNFIKIQEKLNEWKG